MDKNHKRKRIDELIEITNKTRYINPKETMKLANEALSLSEEIAYELGKAISLLRISEAYINIGDYEKALDILFEPLDFFIKEGIYDLQWMVYNLLGITFGELGDYERSMDFYSNAEAASKRIDGGKKYDIKSSTIRAIIIVFNNMAENYKFLKDYEEALIYFNKAYEMDKELDFQPSKGITLLSLGEIYYLLNDYEKADLFSRDVLKYFSLYNYSLAETNAYQLLALIAWKKENFTQADEYFDRVINMNNKEVSPYYQIGILISYYEYLEDRGRLKDALNALESACDLSLKYNILEKTTELSALLAEFYEKLGEHEAAFKYYKMHYEYEKAFMESMNKKRINGLNAKKKMVEIENEKKEIVENNEILKKESEELQMIVEKISIISELGQKITSTLNLDSIADILHISIKNFMNMSSFGIGLYDEKNSRVNYLNCIDNGEKVENFSTRLDDKDTFAGKCIKSRQIIIVNDINTEFVKYMDNNTYKAATMKNNYILNSLIFCPLLINNQVIGIMTIQSKEKNAFTPYHVELIKSLSAYASIAVNNAIKSMELEKEIERRRDVQVELEGLNEKLMYLSEKDAMTGIYNRRKFDSYINELWDNAIAEKSHIALILFDIDCFKEYNDNYGHVQGDKCIIQVAKALASIKSRENFAARYGGDEFVIVLPKCYLEDALKFGEILKSKIAELNILHGFSKIADRVTASIGITSIIPSNKITINEFIRKTDNALYNAKKRGRNQIASVD
jgi:diguanylate cyclase (GGDEF)-like protein